MNDEIIGGEYIPTNDELLANAEIIRQANQIAETERIEQIARESAIKKLQKLGFTKIEAQAVIGIS